MPAVLAAAGRSEEVVEAACIAAWKHAVGDTLSLHTVPVELRDSVLVIVVEDNVWQKQLETMRGQFLFRLNSILGSALVQKIEFRIDARRFRHSDGEGKKSQEEKSEANRAIPIELLSASAAIADAGLRRAFLGAAMSCDKRLECQEIDDLKSEI